MPWQAMTQKALEFCATEIQAETIVEEVHYRRQRAPAPEAGIENPTYYDHPKFHNASSTEPSPRILRSRSRPASHCKGPRDNIDFFTAGLLAFIAIDIR